MMELLPNYIYIFFFVPERTFVIDSMGKTDLDEGSDGLSAGGDNIDLVDLDQSG